MMPNNPALLRPICDLNERAIKAAAPGDVLRDGTIKGLHLRVTTQSKTYYLYYRTKAGIERRPKIGQHGSITLTAARDIAQKMLAKVALGGDPSLDTQEARNEPTMNDLWDAYWQRHGQHKKSGVTDKILWNTHLKPRFGSKRLSQMTYDGISDFMDATSESPISANRSLALLSKMFSMAVQLFKWTNGNPAKGVRRYKETQRRRYMKGEEAARIAEALNEAATDNPASVAFIYLLILTGARKSEIANARWSYLDGNVLRLPDSKTGFRQVFLPESAMEVLGRLPRAEGTITGIASPQKLWRSIRVRAGAADLRLHDLRHSFASAAISAGLSLAQIGELLGHSSTQTTKRYAHLVEEAASAAANATADRIMSAMKNH